MRQILLPHAELEDSGNRLSSNGDESVFMDSSSTFIASLASTSKRSSSQEQLEQGQVGDADKW